MPIHNSELTQARAYDPSPLCAPSPHFSGPIADHVVDHVHTRRVRAGTVCMWCAHEQIWVGVVIRIDDSTAVYKMPLYYGLVARGKIVLCDHAEVSGNFEALCQGILQTKREHGSKIRYTHVQTCILCH